MKETPMLFSGPMVRAILAGTKIMTRRIVNPQPKDDCHIGRPDSWIWKGHHTSREALQRLMETQHPFGQKIWVKETFSISGNGYFYRADVKQPETIKYSWTPSIYMPRLASRITLEVTGVRVERLQSITSIDVQQEGIVASPPKHWYHASDGYEKYRNLWDKLNGKRRGGIYAWDKNPFVWIISFKKL